MWHPQPFIKHEILPTNPPTADDAARSRWFSPLRVGRLDLAERTWVPAMVPWRATEDGLVTPEVLAWYERFARGLMLLVIGLVKKVAIGDELAGYVNPVFDAAAQGAPVAAGAAWQATLGFTFQIYFDFSGYTDMALGIALLFGVVLPQNFQAPYRAKSLQDFWRRWHMTLSRFLRDYVYIPLGGNRKGEARMLAAAFATFVIGGFWHGAAWTFVVWGALHGGALVVLHFWKKLGRPLLVGKRPMSRVGRAIEKGETEGFMKVVVDAETRKILGAAILGTGGDEAIHGVIDMMNADRPYDVLQWAVKTAVEAFHKAQDARQKEAARKEVDEALEALRRARLEAGLPVK